MEATENKNCPYCDEEIKATALKCKYCLTVLYDGESLKNRDPAIKNLSDEQLRMTEEPTSKCSECGYKLKKNANFCTYCGKAVE